MKQPNQLKNAHVKHQRKYRPVRTMRIYIRLRLVENIYALY